jgi:hypothetical protein
MRLLLDCGFAQGRAAAADDDSRGTLSREPPGDRKPQALGARGDDGKGVTVWKFGVVHVLPGVSSQTRL